ncbi:hypothetical protein ACFV85_14825 [Streptomyces niveus]|uniref:hypothetical protein n=1 Tax=Streptomyces niveus TaxID=193462 RepID=UPI00364CFF66
MENQPKPTPAQQLGHASVTDTTAAYGSPLTPEIVSAILRDPESRLYPSRITVFCDDCGTDVTNECMVSEEQTSAERLEVARVHMRAKGWQCDQAGDFCPAHRHAASAEPTSCAKCRTAFDPTDGRFDGRARHARTPYCRHCIDRCHESTDAFHVCAICR